MLELVNKIIEMSVQASFVICIILIVRFVFLKINVPKQLIYVLWAIPLFRLVCPVTIATKYSLMPADLVLGADIIDQYLSEKSARIPGLGNVVSVNGEVPPDYGYQQPTSTISQEIAQKIQESGGSIPSNSITIEGIPGITDTIVTEVVSPTFVFSIIWLIGICALVAYSIISTALLHRKMVGSVWVNNNYYRADHIDTPFVLGIIRPKIYLPSSLAETDMDMIIKHEEMHIRRKDHIVKLVVFAVTCVHWFNPWVWVLFMLFCRDMESAVDEKVISKLDVKERQSYATLLLALSTGHKHLLSAPLAFGEGDVKSRIKHVMNVKKTGRALVVVAVVIVIGLAAALVTSQEQDQDTSQPGAISGAQMQNTESEGQNLGTSGPDFDITNYEMKDAEAITQTAVECFGKTYPETTQGLESFACDFLTYLEYGVRTELNQSFEPFVSDEEYIELIIYVETLQRYMAREKFAKGTEWQKRSDIGFGKSMEVETLDEHRYLVTVPYVNQDGVGEAVFLLGYTGTRPSIENLYIGMAGGIDEVVLGSLEDREIRNPEKWLDIEWAASVMEKLDAYGDQLLEQAQKRWPSYKAGTRGDYYASGDATWSYGDQSYAYRLVFSGVMNAAAKGTTFTVLSNDLNLSFDDVLWASGISSNMGDYFTKDRAQIVDRKSYDLPVTELPTFEYTEDSDLMRVICNYMVARDLTSNEAHKTVLIPAPVIVHVDDSNPEYIKVWANLWSDSYVLNNTTLVSESGGENPCVLYIREEDGRMVVWNVDQVGDGSDYTKDMKAFCEGYPGLYQKFLATSDSRNESCVNVRTEMVKMYVNYHNLNVDSYQDFGLDPVYLD